MPKRQDIKKIMIIGSGPIVIGQACEFDYSGTQACKALKKEGYEVVLVNSNPATIMTDPDVAHKVYIEPLTLDFLKQILQKEKPQALIPTLGGQTALNLALDLHRDGVLDELKVEMLGAQPEVIRRAEDREIFCRILDSVGALYPQSQMIRSFDQGVLWAEEIGFPLILRPNFTLGGGGGGVAYSMEEFKTKLVLGLHESPTQEVLVERSIQGWKEFELEIMRDAQGTFVVVCSIENIDPCGVHTGDSITVAPQMTLSDRQYQEMRDEALKITHAVGVETGGANIQFAVHPLTGQRMVIEMNPRVSRSSALASKATGFPIAKIAALLAVGYQLHELLNDITRSTPSCYEPALDYVVTKIPRFAFNKYPGVKDELSTQMKSVGEAMGIGRTFAESFQKALLSLEKSEVGLEPVPFEEQQLGIPSSQRIYQIFQAFREGWSPYDVIKITEIAPWFIEQFYEIYLIEKELKKPSLHLTKSFVQKAKRQGFSDASIAFWSGKSLEEIENFRKNHGIRPGFFQVDTCAGEFQAATPYFYSTYWTERGVSQNRVQKTCLIIGSGPNRIGQGIEFDYSCVRGVWELQSLGYHVVLVNSNPETVSTDYDTSNELYFEPLTRECLLELMDWIQPDFFVGQLGGQTPLNLSRYFVERGHKLIGSSLKAIDLAEDRSQFIQLCQEFGFKIPRSNMVSRLDEALKCAQEIGYPIMCRPSYVLGGRRMEVVESDEDLHHYFNKHRFFINKDAPCLMDQFLERALEVDVDLIQGNEWGVIGGIVEHIEAAGVHSGDSMGVIPPQRLKPEICSSIEKLSLNLASKMGIRGFLNLQLAIKNDEIYMIEANPRSSRSIPFIAKATRSPLITLGIRAMLGHTYEEVFPLISKMNWRNTNPVSVKGVVFPFKKFAEADSLLGPEMKSTGESMGRGKDFVEALYKAYLSSGFSLPLSGEVFLSLREKDKQEMLPLAFELKKMGFTISATSGTAQFLGDNGIECVNIRKVHEGRPNCVDRIRSGKVALVINTTSGKRSIEASFGIRRSCVDYSIPCLTESESAQAFILALRKKQDQVFCVEPLES